MSRARLYDLNIEEVSAVDEPANGRTFLVIKRVGDQMSKNNVTAEDIAKLPENVQKLLKDLTDKAEQNDTKVKDAEEATGLLAKIGKLFKGESDAPEPDAVVKDADPKVQAAYAAMKKQSDATDAKLAAMQKQMDTNEMIAVAKTVPHLGKPDDVAGELRIIKANLDEDGWKAYLKRQQAVATQLAKSVLFKEMGAGDAGGSKGGDAITAIAKKLRAADPKLTKAQSEAKALETDEGREAYKEHDDARRDR